MPAARRNSRIDGILVFIQKVSCDLLILRVTPEMCRMELENDTIRMATHFTVFVNIFKRHHVMYTVSRTEGARTESSLYDLQETYGHKDKRVEFGLHCCTEKKLFDKICVTSIFSSQAGRYFLFAPE